MAKRKSVMTPERKSRIKEMLSTRFPAERDSSPLMQAANKARVKGKGKDKGKAAKY